MFTETAAGDWTEVMFCASTGMVFRDTWNAIMLFLMDIKPTDDIIIGVLFKEGTACFIQTMYAY
jgi:hypothetical protein